MLNLNRTLSCIFVTGQNIIAKLSNGTNPRCFQNENSAKGSDLLIVSGPSGVGKSTILKLLLDEYPDCFSFSISHTTRSPRNGEINGKDYYFVSKQNMIKAIKNSEFLEYAEFAGNMYGTSKKVVNDVIGSGKICVLDIEMEGVQSLKRANFRSKFIFIKPPSIQFLEHRLRGRGTDSDESIKKRLEKAKQEITFSETPGVFDLILINRFSYVTYQHLKKFLEKDIEYCKRKNYVY